MKGIASSLSHGTTSNNPKKTKLTEDEECDTFGSYLTESLRKLDPETRHIAQYHVNNILFQAQMGILNKSQMVPQQQQPFFAQQQFPSQLTSTTTVYLPSSQSKLSTGVDLCAGALNI
jgi:hypothetical protein